ncbi:hypothetical protein BAC2_03595 [uncultured bacterium]|nr:hypothetical protein BAC2_03595 [uncultured bacterium]
MARGRDGINGTSINRMLDGMWVKTIVLIRPIFSAIFTASRADMPASTLAKKKMLPSTPDSTPNFTWNQYAIMLCTIRPPAKASSANNMLSLTTTFCERCRPNIFLTSTSGLEFVTSMAGETARNKIASSRPPAA